MPTEPTLIGRTLAGRFQVERLVGEGAMACVYQATQKEEPRQVALKVMHPELATEPTFLRRFRREAKAAACLRHKNVVSIVDWGVDGDLAFIAMEMLDGMDLFDVLATLGKMPQARAVRILLQVCDGLQHAHDRGIIHRDLKPENVMLLRDPGGDIGDRVKVLDFGIAKVRERERSDEMPSVSGSALTNVGSALGTPEYMSPEQCEGADVDARADVYTCGAMAYRIVVGRVPFFGAIPLDTMLRHLRDPPTPPRSYVRELHPRLEAIILKALAKRPADRQQSARELGAELAALLPELPHVAPPRAARAKPVISSPRRRTPIVAADTRMRREAAADPETDPDTTTGDLGAKRAVARATLGAPPSAPTGAPPSAPRGSPSEPPTRLAPMVPRPSSRGPASSAKARAEPPAPPSVPPDMAETLVLPASEAIAAAALVDEPITDPTSPASTDPRPAEIATPPRASPPPPPPPAAIAPFPIPPPPPSSPVAIPDARSLPAPVAPSIGGERPMLGTETIAAVGIPLGATATAPPPRQVRVLPLFFVTFSIVLALGIALMRLATVR